MLLGILSDTHDRADAMAMGVRLLRAAGAAYYVHCGDVGSEDVLDALAGEQAAFVFGNNDWDHAGLRRYAATLGVSCLGAWGTLELAGKRVAVTHGDDPSLLRRLVDAQDLDYVLLGHSHLKEDERFGRTRVLNPGALYRAKVKSVALLNLTTDECRWIDVPVPGR